MTDTPYLHRHSLDPSLWIFNGYYYNGMRLNWQQGPFIHNYLQRIDQTIKASLTDHESLMAVRVDLRLPFQFDWKSQPDWRPVFDEFIATLKDKIAGYQVGVEPDQKGLHPTEIRFIWDREFDHSGDPQYHCALFFHNQAFRRLGKFNAHSGSLYGLISSAWATAVGRDEHLADGLINTPRKHTYRVKRGERYDDLFYNLSYFARLASKRFGLADHNFGTSKLSERSFVTEQGCEDD
jgi:hypothetical protein